MALCGSDSGPAGATQSKSCASEPHVKSDSPSKSQPQEAESFAEPPSKAARTSDQHELANALAQQFFESSEFTADNVLRVFAACPDEQSPTSLWQAFGGNPKSYSRGL